MAVSAYYQRYLDYLLSDHWKNLRTQRKAMCGGRCEDCGASAPLQGHHIQYRNLTDCTVADIVMLCQHCHDKKHQGKGHQKRRERQAKNNAQRELAQQKRWAKEVGAMWKRFRKSPSPAAVDKMILELKKFRERM